MLLCSRLHHPVDFLEKARKKPFTLLPVKDEAFGISPEVPTLGGISFPQKRLFSVFVRNMDFVRGLLTKQGCADDKSDHNNHEDRPPPALLEEIEARLKQRWRMKHDTEVMLRAVA